VPHTTPEASPTRKKLKRTTEHVAADALEEEILQDIGHLGHVGFEEQAAPLEDGGDSFSGQQLT